MRFKVKAQAQIKKFSLSCTKFQKNCLMISGKYESVPVKLIFNHIDSCYFISDLGNTTASKPMQDILCEKEET